MQYRNIGKWGIRVSEVALGSWLTYGGMVDEKKSIEQIHFAYEHGINFFDTANVYAHGRAEEVVGKAIKSMRRDSLVLATKVYFPMEDGPNDRGLSRKHVFEQCHLSLKRLSVDYIDLYQCHRFDPNTPIEETVRTMGDLSHQGKILYWGVSEWTGEQIEAATIIADDMNVPPPISNQPQYNMLVRKIEANVLPVCKKLGMGQVAFSPLAQGILTGKYKVSQPIPKDSRAANDSVNAFMAPMLNKENLAIVERLQTIAQEHGLSMSQLALAWCLRLDGMSSVIIGATKTAQIEDNIKASGKKLPEETLKAIDAILMAPVRT